MKITIKDIANKANVSIATVSRALNHQDKSVNFTTKQKIFDTARILKYPLNKKKNLSNRNIGIISRYLFPNGILKQQALGFYTTILNAIEKWLRYYEYNTIFSSYEEKMISQSVMPKWITEKTVSGAIIIGKVDISLPELLTQNQIPFVIINYRFYDVKYNTILSDNYGGAYNLITYLLRLGHRHIGFIRESTDHPSFDERFRGYVQALKDNNIQVNNDYILNEDYNITLGYDSAMKLLRLQEPPTAIFGVNDYVAMNIIKAITDFGLKVPEDISVVGFDAMSQELNIQPALTSARVFAEEMVKLGIERLMRISVEDLPPVRITLASPIVENKSCAVCKTKTDK